MKFLCVPCDSPMKLETVGPPQGGSLSVVYSCPECGYEMAMLTNPFETQLVQSLGVRIGPANVVGASGGPAAAPEAAGPSVKCPFAAMMPGADNTLGAAAATAPSASAGAGQVQPGQPLPVRWTSGAEARLANVPAFVRPMARTGIESYARERGTLEVDETILDAAREFFGM